MADPGIAVRRRVVLLLIAAASLASIGTSARPSQAPSISSIAVGDFILSAAEPIASVDIEVSANAAIRSDPTSRTQVRIGRTSESFDGTQGQPVLLAIQPLDPPGSGAMVAAWPQFTSFFDDGCPAAADCMRRYRITAVLTDPAAIDEPIAVSWSAAAENRHGSDDKPVAVPAGASLNLEAGEPASVPPEHLVRAALPMAERRLDAANPRFVQLVTVTRPQGAGVIGGLLSGAMLRVVRTPDDPESRNVGGPEVRVEDLEGGVVSRGNDGGTQHLDLPACVDVGGCTTPLRVIGEWDGGGPRDGQTIEWSIAAAAFSTDDAALPAPGSVAVEAGDLVTPLLQPAGAVTGTFATGGGQSVGTIVAVEFDRADIDAAGGSVFLQATLRADTTSRSGSAESVRLAVAGGYAFGKAGDEITTASRVVPIDCSTGACRVNIRIDGSAYQNPSSDVEVAWELTAWLFADPPASVVPGTIADFTVSDVP